MNKKKVVIIVNELLRGGAQRIILDIAKNINHSEFDLHVVTLKAENNFPSESKTLLSDLLKTNTRVTMIGGRQKFSIGEFLRLVRFLRREKPDVVHTFLPYAGTVGRIASRIAGFKNIISTQCNLPVAYSKKVYWLDKLTLSLAKAWVGATEGIELHYGGSSECFDNVLWQKGRRHFSIVAGVDLEKIEQIRKNCNREEKRRSLGIAGHDKLILMTARLISWKGHQEVIEAMKFLPADFHVAFAGWGPLEDDFKSLAKNLGVEGRVHFLGVRDDIYELLSAADFYVQAFSRLKNGGVWVGPNTALIEAAAAGIPIVCTSVPLINKLIEDGVTGKLAKIGDPESYASAIQWYDLHKELVPGITSQALDRVRKFYTVYTMVRQTESLYEAVINS